MTWIIASPTIFGYGVGVSDIRVTLSDGTTRDCLQKIYKVGDDIAVGFSGSVWIGFEMVEELKKFLSDLPQGHAWKPEWVATEWQPFAKNIFSKASAKERALGCSLILIGVVPNETLGDAPFAKTFVAILRWPNFEPTGIKIGQWDGIGSGMGVNEYKAIIAELNKGYSPLMQMEMGNPGGFGFAVQVDIRQAIAKRPTQGVSSYVHLCIVRPGEITLTGINVVEYKQEGKKIYNMPRVATSWEELEQITGLKGEALAGSSCGEFFFPRGTKEERYLEEAPY